MNVAQTNIALYRQVLALGWAETDLARLAASYELAMRLFGNRFRSNGKPFICHLVGTASILAAHDPAPDLVIAGLLHATYMQGDFGGGARGATASRRTEVRAAAGEKAEALIAAYADLPWPLETGNIDPALALMRLANEIEDHLDGAMAFGSKQARTPDDPIARRMIALGSSIGHSALADQLAQVIAEQPAVPAGLRRSARESFSVNGRRGRLARWWPF